MQVSPLGGDAITASVSPLFRTCLYNSSHPPGESHPLWAPNKSQRFIHSPTHNALWWSTHDKERPGGFIGIFIYQETTLLYVTPVTHSVSHSFLSRSSFPPDFLSLSVYLSLSLSLLSLLFHSVSPSLLPLFFGSPYISLSLSFTLATPRLIPFNVACNERGASW